MASNELPKPKSDVIRLPLCEEQRPIREHQRYSDTDAKLRKGQGAWRRRSGHGSTARRRPSQHPQGSGSRMSSGYCPLSAGPDFALNASAEGDWQIQFEKNCMICWRLEAQGSKIHETTTRPIMVTAFAARSRQRASIPRLKDNYDE
jgi:hypothetical protein